VCRHEIRGVELEKKTVRARRIGMTKSKVIKELAAGLIKGGATDHIANNVRKNSITASGEGRKKQRSKGWLFLMGNRNLPK